MAKTKAISGVSVSRKGNYFTISWKSNDSNIQKTQLKYWIADSSLEITKTFNGNTTSFETRSISHFWPDLNWAETSWPKDKIKSLKKKLVVKIRQKRSGRDYSNWVEFEQVFDPPKKPDITWEQGAEDGDTTFKWDVPDVNDTNNRPYMRIIRQMMYVENSAETDGSKLNWASAPYRYSTDTTGTFQSSHSAWATTDDSKRDTASQWARIIAIGRGGWEGWKYIRRVFAYPNRSVIQSASGRKIASGVYELKASWNTTSDGSRPCDYTTIEYGVGAPTANMGVPEGIRWEPARSVGRVRADDSIRTELSTTVNDDNCIFVRVNTHHDNFDTYGIGALAYVGKLHDPARPTVRILSADNRTARITSNYSAGVDGAFLAVYFRNEAKPADTLIVGVIPNGDTYTDVTFPTGATEVAFGVKAFVGSYSSQTRADGVTNYTISSKMESENIVWANTSIPMPPTGVTATQVDGKEDTIRVTWNWSWPRANYAVISWADHDDAWESTDEPNTYEVWNTNASQWYIKGIDIGKTWYVSVRLGFEDENEELESAWSEPIPLDLAVAPKRPSLALSSPAVTDGGEVTASWTYNTSDGTAQMYAEICKAVVNDRTITYGDIIAHADTVQHVSFSTTEAEMQAGNSYSLCVRTVSASGKQSEWSDPVPLKVVSLITATIDRSQLQTTSEYIEEEDRHVDRFIIDDLPYSITSVFTGEVSEYNIAIERNGAYVLERPDEDKEHGFDKETIASIDVEGTAQITQITKDTLLGSLDDGASYNIILTARDGAGQVATDTVEVTVEWTEQATPVDATVTTDLENNVVKITPEKELDGEAYTVFDSANGSLKFFRDEPGKYTNEQTDGTKTYYTGLETSTATDTSNAPWYSNRASVQSVTFEDVIKPKSTACWFDGMNNTNFTSITGLDKLDISNVTNMKYMFRNSYNLTTLDLSHFDTSNVTNMEYMFRGCTALTSIDVSHFDTSKVTNMNSMFAYCSRLTTTLNIMNMPSTYMDMCYRTGTPTGTITLKYVVPVTSADIDTLVATKYSEDNLVVNGGEGTFVSPEPPINDGSVCDIYRLSADKPVKILSEVPVGETYVDPYPAFGAFGGHRIVSKTKNGDYITADNQFAWKDTGAGNDTDDFIDADYNIIDFGEDQIKLTRNLDYDSSWQKDFTETQYLGGSIQGDWNPAVRRSGNMSTVAITLTDMDEIRAMRRLAAYAGICHLRTRDGSSYACNIDVSETREHLKYEKVVSFAMSITRVDDEGLDGLTEQEWEEQQE